MKQPRSALLALLTCGTGLALLSPAGAQASPLTLYVAPNGNDQWSGHRARPKAGGTDGPLATLSAALQAAREARRPEGSGAVTIFLREGTYHLEAPLTLTPADSGVSAQQPFLIAAYRGEHPVLSGGRRLTGWHPVAGQPGRWQTEVPAVRAGQWYFRQLFVNGQRRQRARTPNHGYFRIEGPSSQDKPMRLKFRPGDIKPAWAQAGDVEVVAMLAWADIRMPIRAVDETTHTATLAGEPRPSNRENDAQYYIENAPDGLDEPGEWYLDRQTGVVTYWALPGEDLTQAVVTAPRLPYLMAVRGDLDGERAVHHLILRGLTFAETDWSLGPKGYADTQAAVAVPGDLRAEGAVDCAVEDCTFTRLAGYALELGRGCQRWRVVGNTMFDLGAGGIRIGETGGAPTAFDDNQGQVITDNEVHDAGLIFHPAVGVLILQSHHNRVVHNHIHHLFYTAISVGWTWGYRESPCHDNLIAYNHLHDLGQSLLSDMGGVYTLGIQKGTVVRNNLIHDVNSFTYGGWGLYTDEGSTDILLENNVVYRCKSANFHQHYGRENVLRNNIFAFGREYQLMRTRPEPHISFSFTNNIVYFDTGKLLGSNWSNDNYVMDHNLYFDARPGASPATMNFDGRDLAAWQARGHDRHSVVADPLFVDPAAADFRLRPGSPALKLGFKPIDPRDVGVRPKNRRGAE